MKILVGLIIILAILILSIILLSVYMSKDKKEETELAYTDLIKEISNGNIEKIEMTVGSTTLKVKVKDQEEEKTSIVPSTEAFMEMIQQKTEDGKEFELIQKPRSVQL